MFKGVFKISKNYWWRWWILIKESPNAIKTGDKMHWIKLKGIFRILTLKGGDKKFVTIKASSKNAYHYNSDE